MAILNNLDGEPMTDINMTPLIDVMLVLLIVFMVTLPVLQHAVKLDLPKASSRPMPPPQAPVSVDINRDAQVLWNQQVVDETALATHLAEAAAQPDPPTLQLYADRMVRYEAVARVLSAAQRAGLNKIEFITEPQNK